ncbi:hypothetical protein PU560_07885, partial [Georgenia sp. 10Sc9-8]|nr:hypothetical protein [Georgenia halotolerans]
SDVVGLGRGTVARMLGARHPAGMAPFASTALSDLFGHLAGVGQLQLDGLRRYWLPANLIRVPDLSLQAVKTVANEGICLYGVPRPSLVESLLGAPDAASRRTILGRSWRPITDDCEAALDQCVAPQIRYPVSVTRKAITALRAGHVEASQALLANTLDSTLTIAIENQQVPSSVRRAHAVQSHSRELTVRGYLVLAPIGEAHRRYRPAAGELVPQQFNRHASVHSVSRRQYSRRNAVQALLQVTGLIAFLNEMRVARRFSV